MKIDEGLNPTLDCTIISTAVIIGAVAVGQCATHDRLSQNAESKVRTDRAIHHKEEIDVDQKNRSDCDAYHILCSHSATRKPIHLCV